MPSEKEIATISHSNGAELGGGLTGAQRPSPPPQPHCFFRKWLRLRHHIHRQTLLCRARLVLARVRSFQKRLVKPSRPQVPEQPLSNFPARSAALFAARSSALLTSDARLFFQRLAFLLGRPTLQSPGRRTSWLRERNDAPSRFMEILLLGARLFRAPCSQLGRETHRATLQLPTPPVPQCSLISAFLRRATEALLIHRLSFSCPTVTDPAGGLLDRLSWK